MTCYYDSTALCVDVEVSSGQPVRRATTQYSTILSSSKSGGVGYISLKTPTASNHPYFMHATFVEGKWDAATNLPSAPTTQIFKYVRFQTNEVFASGYINDIYLFPEHYFVSWGIVQDQAGFQQYKMRAALQIKGGYYAGLGFANTSMGGPLVACHLPQNDALQVVCRDFIGQVGGGVVVNPVQSSKVVSAVAEPVREGRTSLSFIIVDIDLANFNVSWQQAMQPDNYQRMIFAYGTWNESTSKPTYHGPNHTFFHVNIFSGATNGTAPATHPPHATPAPVHYMLQQTSCSNSKCSESCQTESIHTDRCLGLTGGDAWAIATCEPSQGRVSLAVYLNKNCTGSPVTTRDVTLDTCTAQPDGGSIKDKCVPASQAALGSLVDEGKTLIVPGSKAEHPLKKFM